MYNCRKCGRLLDDSADVCAYCGEKREVTTVSLENNNANVPVKKKKTGLYIAVIAVALLVAVGAVVGVLIYNGTIDLDEIFSKEEESSYDDSEYGEYFEKADKYVKKNKYDEALAVIDTAKEKLGESDELTAKRLEIRKAQIIYMCSEYAEDEDYRKAFLYAHDNISGFEKDAEILELKNLYSRKYYNMILEFRCIYGDSETEISNAIDFIEEALRYFPEDEKLLELLEVNKEILEETNGTSIGNLVEIPPDMIGEIDTTPIGGERPDYEDTEIDIEVWMPKTTVDIVNFYSAAINRVKYEGVAGYTKKEWQVVDDVNIGADAVNSAVTSVISNFMTTEADAGEQVYEAGSAEAKQSFPPWYLSDLSQIAGAECKDAGNGNYKITIIMKDEDTPKRIGSVLGQVTNSVLYWEDIDATLSGDDTVKAILSSYSGIHVIYKGYTITAEITPYGEFVTLEHTADVDIVIGEAKILKIFTIKDKNGHLMNYCKYYDFIY